MSDTVIVVGSRRYGPMTFFEGGNEPAGQDPNPVIDPNGPPPEEPGTEHTNRTDLQGNLVIVDGLEDTSNFYINFGGKRLLITISNLAAPYGSAIRDFVGDALGVLIRAFNAGSQSIKDQISSLDKLVIANVTALRNGGNALPGRSATDESKSTFYYDIDEISNISPGFMASNIFHDAGHVQFYNVNKSYSDSRGVSVEIALGQRQIDSAQIFELLPSEVQFLQMYIGNSEMMKNRVDGQPLP